MKKKSFLSFRLFLFTGFYLLISTSISAQKENDDYEKKMDAYLSTLDLSGIKNNILLNKSYFSVDELEYYRKPVRNSKGQIIASINALEWKSIYERLELADLRKENEKIPNIASFSGTDLNKPSKNNTIPIGIINLDATFLNQEQVKENSKEKQRGTKANTDKYEKFFFIAASVLQKDIYQSDINFRIGPSLHLSNNKNEIKRIEIDFQDGKGYRSFDLKEQVIPYRFSSLGERSIAIRIYTQRGTYVFYSRIDVKQLVRPKMYVVK